MSTRQDVFGYLEKHPQSTLQEVLKKVSQAKETTVRRYYFEYQKTEHKPEKPSKKKTAPIKKAGPAKKSSPPKKRSKKTVKQQVYDFMEKSPEASLKELHAAFPGSQKTTVGNYRRFWIKENETSKDTLPKTKRNEILNYLNNNPASNINDLKKVFPDVANKLITIFRSWKDSQKRMPNAKKLSEVKTALSEKSQNIKEKSHNWLEKQKKTIAKQKDIIDKQQTRIEALKSQLPDVKKPRFMDLIKDFLVKKVLNR
jgi:hypothetical protein